ncbi:MAG: tetratricopeptide repeat protein, partial [Pseudomonadales bacterium]|nr:tetratricopeptide repeat protein [Pseudomonadales bacterium]
RQKLQAAAIDREPLVRLAAVQASRLLPAEEQQRLLLARLNDPMRAVRIEAARIAVGIPDERLDSSERARRDAVVQELVASETIHLDRPESHLNLALIDLARGDVAAAESSLQQALRMDPGFVPARINLADLYRASARDGEVEPLLHEGLRLAPDSADLKHALGLLAVRQGKRAAALVLLAEAASLAPDNPRYAYVHAVALLDSGNPAEALAVARDALERTPNDPALAQLLAQLEAGAPRH